MATVAELVQGAFREGNLIPVGTQPSTAELAEGVTLFNRLWQMFVGGKDIGERLGQWAVPPSPTSPVPARYPLAPQPDVAPNSVWPYPPQNQILQCRLTQATTVYLRPNPSPGAKMAVVNLGTSFAAFPLTINANGLQIDGGASVTISADPTEPLMWFFRDDLGEWVRVVTLAAADDSPLPSPAFDDLFTCSLAVRMSPRFGKVPSDITAATARHAMSVAQTRYMQEQAAATDPDNLWQMPFQAYGVPWWGGLGW